jgi:hypothetical protein
MTFGRKDKSKESIAIPGCGTAVPISTVQMPPPKPRPILEEMRRRRREKQEQVAKARSLVNALIQDIGVAEKELSLCRFDEQYVEDHPQIEDIFTPDFLARFTGQLRREDENHGQTQAVQEKGQEGQGQAGAAARK